MKILSHQNRSFVVQLSEEERDGMTGRAYIRKLMKEKFGGGIPNDQIKIKNFYRLRGYFNVVFNKKSQEYETLFKLLS